jgi:hypothetical protein
MDSGSLISAIDPNELLVEAPNLIAWKIGAVSDMDGVAQFMYKGGPYSPQAAAKPRSGEDGRPEKSLWECVKHEMRIFLCTDEARYQPLWKRITDLENRNTSVVVGVIAAFLAQLVGAPATLLAGFVAVCLYGAAKLGKEAYCRYLSQPQDS